MNRSKNLAACVAVQIAAVFGFIEISRTSLAAVGKPTVLLLFGALSVLFLAREARRSTVGRTLIICAALAAVLVMVHQVLAFTIYPGLLKEVGILTAEKVRIAVQVFIIALIGYLAAAVMALMSRKLRN